MTSLKKIKMEKITTKTIKRVLRHETAKKTTDAQAQKKQFSFNCRILLVIDIPHICSHRRSQGGLEGMPQKRFSYYIVILYFERRHPKQNSVIR